MRYYITSDVHGFYTPLRDTLEKGGFFRDAEPHRLVVAGDLFDRGGEAVELQNFILDFLERDEVILIRGNHEDLFVELVTTDNGVSRSHHLSNGTYDTAIQLTGYSMRKAILNPLEFARAARETPYYKTILRSMRDYYETKNYIITHGWIPCVPDGLGGLAHIGDWRKASKRSWRQARWLNGMDAVRTVYEDDKTIVCGHWHTSYGHSRYEGEGQRVRRGRRFQPLHGAGDHCAGCLHSA